jgi:capsular exopolysaccharide synthesis family protein
VTTDPNIKDNINSTSTKETVIRYLSFYPLFIASLLICFGASVLYIRYTVPKYNANTLILVKNGGEGSSGNASKDIVDNAVSGGNTNLENDMILLRSSSLMDRVVAKNKFNISYYKIGKVIEGDIYNGAPFQMVPLFIKDSSQTFSFTVTNITATGGVMLYGPENNKITRAFTWNKPLHFVGAHLVLIANGNINDDPGNYRVTWRPVEEAAWSISRGFSVGMSGTNNTVIELNLKIENLAKGKDILNGVASEFVQANIAEKNKIARSTIYFIDERLGTVSKQLSGVEGNLESFRGKSQILDPAGQASQTLSNSNTITKSLSDLRVQQQVVAMIRQYVGNPAYAGKLVPSTLGIADGTLSALIVKYNDLQLTKEREMPLNAAGSLVVKDLDAQIGNVRISILESLHNISKNLQLQSSNLEQQNMLNNQFLTSLPAKEKSLQEMKRQQSITEGLFLYLLQKREETALSLSSTISSYRQIDPATGYGPVEPNQGTIFKVATILGLLLPIGFIYIRDLLNDKVSSRNDITEKTFIPISGEIGHIKKNHKKLANKLFVSQSDELAQDFQIMRTNLSVFHKKNEKHVFLVTSGGSGEGKSFVSYNLAAVLAKSGKSVALLEFDLRKPDGKSVAVKSATRGLSNFLSGDTMNLSSIFFADTCIQNLHIYPTGSSNYDPADLLINDRLPQLFEELKLRYDYVIMNSAPVDFVGDALILSTYSNLVLYVVREGYTEKKKLAVLEDFSRTGKLDNICVVVNDVKRRAWYGNYAYGTN